MAQSVRNARWWVSGLAVTACLSGVATLHAAQKDQPKVYSFVPALRVNFPDAFVLRDGAEFLAYSTNTDRINVPMATSRDLANWSQVRDAAKPGQLHDAMPTLPAWAKRGLTWAPEVIKTGSVYVLYFTARHAKSDLQCIGAAISASPRGSFVDTSDEPLVCQYDLGGTIDAHPFRDSDGQLYLYYKNDGNNPKVLKTSRIWVQRMSADGLKLTGQAVPLVKNDAYWEWRVVEAPAMVRHDEDGDGSGYTLFFSANHFGWESDQRLSNYGTGYANCKGPMGPCTDASDKPWLYSFNTRSEGCLSGPGHPTIFEAGKRRFIAFHAWAATSGCRKLGDKRFLYVAPLMWDKGKPVIGPSLRQAGANKGP